MATNRTLVYSKLKTTREVRKRVELEQKNSCPFCASVDITKGENCFNCNQCQRPFNRPAQQGKGFTTVADGKEDVIYEVTIDHAALAQMARKAASNKNWKSVDGPVQVRVLATKKLENS